MKLGVIDKVDKPLEFIVSNLSNIKDKNKKQLLVNNQKTKDYIKDLNESVEVEVTGKFHGSSCLVANFTEEILEIMKNDNTIIKDDSKFYFLVNSKGTHKYFLEINKKYLWRRRDIRKKKSLPSGWLRTGKENDFHNIGYIPVTKYETEIAYKNIINDIKVLKFDSNEYFVERVDIEHMKEGTYELCGPNMQGNIHKFDDNILIPHGIYKLNHVIFNCFKFDEEVNLLKIKEWLESNEEGNMFEGIVLHLKKSNNIYKYYKIHRGHLGLGSFIKASKFIVKN